jgi:hypothetical protein
VLRSVFSILESSMHVLMQAKFIFRSDFQLSFGRPHLVHVTRKSFSQLPSAPASAPPRINAPASAPPNVQQVACKLYITHFLSVGITQCWDYCVITTEIYFCNIHSIFVATSSDTKFHDNNLPRFKISTELHARSMELDHSPIEFVAMQPDTL